ncbi:MAG: hypothetical protein ACHREM_01910 [Polyangiales bacterium]
MISTIDRPEETCSPRRWGGGTASWEYAASMALGHDHATNITLRNDLLSRKAFGDELTADEHELLQALKARYPEVEIIEEAYGDEAEVAEGDPAGPESGVQRVAGR